jgi:membrane protein implicated in regulation of membrane protease activity
MEDKKPSPESLLDSVKDYISLTAGLYRLKAFNKLSLVSALIAHRALLFLLGVLFFLFLNLGLALWIGELSGKTWLGFFVFAALYLLLTLIVFALKSTLMKRFRDAVIQALMKGEEELAEK